MGLLPAAENYIALRVRFKNSIERKKDTTKIYCSTHAYIFMVKVHIKLVL